jgi:hypothetical protein
MRGGVCLKSCALVFHRAARSSRAATARRDGSSSRGRRSGAARAARDDHSGDACGIGASVSADAGCLRTAASGESTGRADARTGSHTSTRASSCRSGWPRADRDTGARAVGAHEAEAGFNRPAPAQCRQEGRLRFGATVPLAGQRGCQRKQSAAGGIVRRKSRNPGGRPSVTREMGSGVFIR